MKEPFRSGKEKTVPEDYKMGRRIDQAACHISLGRQRRSAFDFVFEITSSTTDRKESEYTIYETYNRTLMIISGESATLEDGDTYSPLPYEQCTLIEPPKGLEQGRAVDYEMTREKVGAKGRVSRQSI